MSALVRCSKCDARLTPGKYCKSAGCPLNPALRVGDGILKTEITPDGWVHVSGTAGPGGVSVSEWIGLPVRSDERVKFEAVAVELALFGCSLDREIVRGVDSYKHAGLNACWLFWQKRAAQSPVMQWKAPAITLTVEGDTINNEHGFFVSPRGRGFTAEESAQISAWASR